MTRNLNIYEWMLLHGEQLAHAIKEDGVIGGARSDPLLEQAQHCDAPGRTKHEAGKLLKLQLTRIGAGHLMSWKG